MTFLTRSEQADLAQLSGITDGRYRAASAPSSGGGIVRAGGADTVITIHLGPDQTPQVARILRSQWPSVAAFNYSEGREFHVRLRQHVGTGVCLVYASVSVPRNDPRPSIFAEVLQRGRLCRNPSQFEQAVAELRQELGILKPKHLP